MIRRLKDGKEASRLRRERRNDKLGRLRRNNDPYLLPDTTPEEMERIIKDSEKKKEKDRKEEAVVAAQPPLFVYTKENCQ